MRKYKLSRPLALFLALASGVCQAAGDSASDFAAQLRSKVEAADKTQAGAIAGKNGWLFLTTELRSLGIDGPFWGDAAAKASHVEDPEARDPLAAIIDFKQQLDQAGIELLLVPVPAKATIYPDQITDLPAPDGKSRLDVQAAAFYQVLAKQGVKVLDLTPEFLKQRAAGKGDLYCKTDSHWSPLGIEIAAAQIAATIKDRPWLKDLTPVKFEARSTPVDITGDLVAMVKDAPATPESVTLNVITAPAGAAGENNGTVERQSPILLLGDSHNLVFHGGGDMLAKDAGLVDQLALKLGTSLDLLGVRGSGATPARKSLARRGAAAVRTKKLVIWCFTSREFTEGQGWSKVKVLRETAP